MHNIPDERRRVRAAFEAASGHGHCETIDLPYATHEELVRTLLDKDYGDQIDLFHFAGHSSGTSVVLETQDGRPSPTQSRGLAQVLGRQERLKLVFLNGCNTEAQATELLAAGVPSVIVTAEAIKDSAAAELAGLFYQGIAAGRSIQRSFDDATSALEALHGPDRRGAYRRSFVPPAEESLPWPWKLYAGRGGQSTLVGKKDPMARRQKPTTNMPAASDTDNVESEAAGAGVAGDSAGKQENRRGDRRKGERRKGERRKGERRSIVDKRTIGPKQRFKNGLVREYREHFHGDMFESLRPVSFVGISGTNNYCDVVYSDGSLNFQKLVHRLENEAPRYRFYKSTGELLAPQDLRTIILEAVAAAWQELRKKKPIKQTLVSLIEGTADVVASKYRIEPIERRSQERRSKDRRSQDRRTNTRRENRR